MAIIQNLEAFVQSYPAGLETVTDMQLSQNENGRQLRFKIGGLTIPAGSVATISGTKPDGVVYSKTGTIEGADTVIFDEDVQMTAVFGTWYAKIRIINAGNTIASARVRFIIDKDPVDAGAIPSESELDGLVTQAEEYAEAAKDAAERAAITYGSPLTASTASAMTDVNRVYVYTGSESGYTYGNWYYYNGSAWVSGGIYNSAAVETDTTLTEPGVPADAKATGDKIAELKDDLSHMITGLTERQKQALLSAFDHVVWDEDDPTGQTYINTLYASLYDTDVDSITVTFSQGDNPIFDSDSLDVLRPLLTVVAHYSNGTSGAVTDYELSGNLSSTTSTIIVTYEDVTATFNVSVTMPTFDYKASRDGLLSAKSGIIIDTNNSSKFSERMSTGGNLRLQGTGTENDYYQFKIGNNPTTGKWRMRTKVLFYDAPTDSFGGFRPNISNGESGLRVSTKKENNAVSLYSYVGNNTQLVTSGLQMGEPERWYDIELFIDSSVPIQRIKIDGETEFESASFANAPKNNSMFMVSTGLIFIDTIQLYNQ